MKVQSSITDLFSVFIIYRKRSVIVEELELLRMFLESADFGQLRSRCEELLLAGKRVSVRLTPGSLQSKYRVELIER